MTDAPDGHRRARDKARRDNYPQPHLYPRITTTQRLAPKSLASLHSLISCFPSFSHLHVDLYQSHLRSTMPYMPSVLSAIVRSVRHPFSPVQNNTFTLRIHSHESTNLLYPPGLGFTPLFCPAGNHKDVPLHCPTLKQLKHTSQPRQRL